MPRYRLTIEHDGTGFAGWQRQARGVSVQEVIEEAAFRFCGERPTVVGAGRTDAGVHARGQVAHLDLTRDWPADTVRAALCFHLKPHAVAVVEVERAADTFHARFDARERRYAYRILNRRSPSALDRGRAWHVARPLDAEAMADAARLLLGPHDFTSFRSAECQARSPVKTLNALDVAREGDDVRVAARARSFLHHQVRILVGTLVLVGEGKWGRRDVAAALAARDRSAAGPTAPAHGLTLLAVRYDEAKNRSSTPS
ncbi:MAG: tRNA pseudouridine(38-40) synthase TruA [Alphaproteobacteria bacterium]|nr:tRNA pseudouridine(38-40) synthase TruA [Alphaproteobacteria bacterium]